VIAGLSPARIVALVAPALVVIGLSGCGAEGYPEDLVYPTRSDVIVTTPPTDLPVYPDLPGHLDEYIAHYPEKGGKLLDPKDLPTEQRNQIAKALEDLFGTPANPRVNDPKAVEELKLDEGHLKAGAVLYRRHCLHCHGLAGDGRGPTGPWVNPHPRDYRQGRFKFISSRAESEREAGRPRRADLERTVKHGIEGTSMPGFNLLAPEEIENLVSYVIHLSLRGEVEFDTLRTLLGKSNLRSEDGSAEGDGTIASHTKYRLGFFAKLWLEMNQNEIKPSPYPEDTDLKASIENGYKLFTQKEDKAKGIRGAGCIECHADYGRQVPFRYDVWGTLAKPANLTAGVYRGGRRPLDLYWRIRGGINPAAMPASPETTLNDKEIWDLVNFIQALPYPRMLPENVRAKIYVTAVSTQVAER
jgi:mono/diheme cytochrome c family protein